MLAESQDHAKLTRHCRFGMLPLQSVKKSQDELISYCDVCFQYDRLARPSILEARTATAPPLASADMQDRKYPGQDYHAFSHEVAAVAPHQPVHLEDQANNDITGSRWDCSACVSSPRLDVRITWPAQDP